MPAHNENAPTSLVIPKPALTTDYLGTGKNIHDFAPLMKDAGFGTALWCEKWDGGYMYSPEEVEVIDKVMSGLGIRVRDIHASEGEHYGQWVSPNESERKKGINLVLNRVEMAEDLGAQTVVLHAPHHEMAWEGGPRGYQNTMELSLGEITEIAGKKGVSIALENCDWRGKGLMDNFPAIEFALSKFSNDLVGICYDSGHGNLMRTKSGDHIGRMDANKDRLHALHLHDNKGRGATRDHKMPILEGKNHDDDMHRLMFTGTVDWVRLAKIIAESTYNGPIMMEASMKYDPYMPPMEWLRKAMETGFVFSAMVEANRFMK